MIRNILPEVADYAPEPTDNDLNSPVFESIWQAIKQWDMRRRPDQLYSGATGTDVMRILTAIRPYLKEVHNL